MRDPKKILAEIEDLQKQAADIMDNIEKLKEKNGIWCINCQFYDTYCHTEGRFPSCIKPNEVWKKIYKNNIEETESA